MRRWNGWGDESVETSLPPRARDLLESLIGPGDAAARRDARRGRGDGPAVAPGRRSGARRSTRGPASGTPAGRAFPTGWRSGAGAWARCRTPSRGPPTRRRSRASWRSAARTGAALIPYGGGTSVVGGVTARPSDRPLVTVDLGRDRRAARPRRDERPRDVRRRDGRPGDRGGPRAVRPDPRPLPAVVRGVHGRRLGGHPLGRPAVARLRSHRGPLRRRPPRDAARTARHRGPTRRRRPDRTCARSSSARRGGSAS